MKKFSVLLLIACINIIFAILLIHKQNTIIALLYDIQQLQEERDQLLEKKKKLSFQLQREQQLSKVEAFAINNLQMKPVKLKEVRTISLDKPITKDTNADRQ